MHHAGARAMREDVERACLRRQVEQSGDRAGGADVDGDRLWCHASIPLVPAKAGTRFFGRALGPWIPAFLKGVYARLRRAMGMSGAWIIVTRLSPSRARARRAARRGWRR